MSDEEDVPLITDHLWNDGDKMNRDWQQPFCKACLSHHPAWRKYVTHMPYAYWWIMFGPTALFIVTVLLTRWWINE